MNIKLAAVAALLAFATLAWSENMEVQPAALFAFQERGVGAKGMGEKASDLLFAALSVRPELYLVERAELQKLLDEQAMNVSGMVTPGQATQIGQLTGAKILITGSVIESDNTLFLVAKVIGTENGRVLGASAEGKASDPLAPLVQQLAENIGGLLAGQSDKLVAMPVSREDRIQQLKIELGDAPRPTVTIHVAERHVGQATLDPAAETELALIAAEAGFTVLDKSMAGSKPDVVLEGEGFSEFATRRGDMICVKARVEIKAVDRATGKVLASDRQTAVAVDLSEQLAGKAALQEAAAQLAPRVLAKVAGR